MKLPVYLDNHSTTKVDEEVISAMLPYFNEFYGNPASNSHSYGWYANEAVKFSREKIAKTLNANPDEIYFTSGSTESNNIILKGISKEEDIHVITSKVEHPSIINTLYSLKNIEVTYLNVDQYGMIDPEDIKKSIRNNTKMVSIMSANNEIGTIYPLKEIGDICEENTILFHTDAAQAIGKLPFDVKDIKADLVSFSAHKNHGPKGIGGLYIKKRSPRIKITPLLDGGGQEKNLRSGTLNVPGIVGMAKSFEISDANIDMNILKMKTLRDLLESNIINNFPEIKVNGHPEIRLPNNLHINIPKIDINKLYIELKDIAFSSGSACASGDLGFSHVLEAIGVSKDYINNSIRFGLSKFTTEDDINYTIGKFVKSLKNIYKFSYY